MPEVSLRNLGLAFADRMAQIFGRSLTLVPDDNPRRLFAPLNPMPATAARTYLKMRPASPRRTFSPDARFVRQK